jgi:uncharacterized protein (TIGR02996 family)
MSDERQKFLDAIKANPYDLKTRKVFADWLDEFGDDRDADLAAEQRAWTKEKQDAIVWVTGYAESLDMTYDELIQAANDFLEEGDVYCLPFDTPQRVWDNNADFWQCFEQATGKTVADEDRGMFFRCAC